MGKRIIHQTAAFEPVSGVYVPTGGVSIITPWLGDGLTIEEIAAKDVPTGLPYKIVDVADIPSDRSNRDLWEVDVADLTDGVGT